jgi:hypothetical protein
LDNIKVSLSITLPGRVLFSKRDCLKEVFETRTLKNGSKKTFRKMVPIHEMEDSFKLLVDKFENNQRIVQPYIVNIRKCKPATQTLNISEIAYKYMISKECPYFMKPKEWAPMNKKLRLEAHLKNIAESLGGEVLGYHVFDD